MKRCRAGGATKPLDAFSPHKSCKQGRYPECKECRNAWARAKYFRDDPGALDAAHSYLERWRSGLSRRS